MWLESHVDHVTEFSTGEACLAALETTKPELILLDLHMPGAGGFTTLRQIKRRHRPLPVVILTVESDLNAVMQTVQDGAYDFLVKPLEEQRLLSTVDRAIESHRASAHVTELDIEQLGVGAAKIVGESKAMQELRRQIMRLRGSDVSVCISGESGTGKELIARAVHARSSRGNSPFVSVNCATIPDSLQEIELFGHEQGTLTHHPHRRLSKSELANGGVLFLDEIGDLTASAQARLLHTLQERQVLPVGSSSQIPVNFRLIGATYRDLRAEVAQGRFREDLYFRIMVFELSIPPLRERKEDIALLIEHTLESLAAGSHGEIELSEAALDVMQNYDWPGNVRELENSLQRAAMSCQNRRILPTDLPPSMLEAVRQRQQGTGTLPQTKTSTENHRVSKPSTTPISPEQIVIPPGLTLHEVERRVIEHTMVLYNNNRSRVAECLGIGRTTLYRKLKDYNLQD